MTRLNRCSLLQEKPRPYLLDLMLLLIGTFIRFAIYSHVDAMNETKHSPNVTSKLNTSLNILDVQPYNHCIPCDDNDLLGPPLSPYPRLVGIIHVAQPLPSHKSLSKLSIQGSSYLSKPFLPSSTPSLISPSNEK